MKRRALVAFLMVATVSGFLALTGRLGGLKLSGSAPGDAQRELVIYTYDSFVAPGGLGPEIFPLFEKSCACRVRALPLGDGGQILTRLELDSERGKTVAQLVVGLDGPSFERARPWLEGWGSWKPEGWSQLREDVRREVGAEEGFLPYDYGFFAFIADSQQFGPSDRKVPRSLKELLGPQWSRSLLLEDPRTSTPGLAFVLYAQAIEGSVRGNGPLSSFWSGFRRQWLTLAPGWDQAYGLFLKKEAPLVWSYTTSQAYHAEHGDSSHRYRALLFDEGQPMQVEGAALVKGARSELARKFLDFLVSPEVQRKIPRHNWMYPVRGDIPLPASFERLPYPKKIVQLPVDPVAIAAALRDWSLGVEGS